MSGRWRAPPRTPRPLLDVIAGYDPADPGSAPAARSGFTSQLDRGVRGLRIGFVRHFHTADVVAGTEISAALEVVAASLRQQGADIVDVTLPKLSEFNAVNRVILHSEAWAIHAKWLQTRPGDYAEATRRRLLAGAFLSAGDYIQAAAAAHGADRGGGRCIPGRRCAADRQFDGYCSGDRRLAGGRADLWPAGPHAVQRHRTSGCRHDVGSFERRVADVGPVRGSGLCRRTRATRRRRLRAGGELAGRNGRAWPRRKR